MAAQFGRVFDCWALGIPDAKGSIGRACSDELPGGIPRYRADTVAEKQ
jgi:hypothetical protein